MKRLAAILAALLLACAAGAQMLPGSSAAFAAFASKLSVAGALAFFDFNDGTGRDLSPYARDLVNVGSVTYGAGYGGGLAPFFDTAGQRLTNGLSAARINCIEFDFNLTNALTTASRDQYPVVMSVAGSATIVGFGATTSLITDELISWWNADSGTSRSAITAGHPGNPTTIAAGWHHLRIAKRNASDALYSAWLDGVEVHVNQNNVTNLSAVFLSLGDYPGNNNPIDGYLDNVLICEKALNEQ